MNPSIASPSMPRGVGYLNFMACLQIGIGVLSVLFSVFAIVETRSISPELLNPVARVNAAQGIFVQLTSAFMAFQMAFGWVFGLLMIVAGICCYRLRGRTFVATAAILNLINFPHGTTAALMMLHGFTRPGISHAFRESEDG